MSIEDKKDNDVIDLISTAAHNLQDVERDGVTQKELVLDPESIYWATRSVNSDTLGRFVYELKTLETLASEALNHMTFKRGIVLRDQLLRLVDAYRKSIDSKSSETKRDDKNAQLNLIDKLSKNKQERIYTVHGDAKKSFLDGLLGKDGDEERDN